MLVTFSSRSSGDITMFGDVAVQLLKLMGHRGIVPSAINEGDVPIALGLLENALDEAMQIPEPEISPGGEDDGNAVSLHTRALPLLAMLRAAAKDESYVMWTDKR